MLPDGAEGGRADDVLDSPTDHVLRLKADGLGVAFVDVLITIGGVDVGDKTVDVVGDHPALAFARQQRFGGPCALGDVGKDREGAAIVSLRVSELLSRGKGLDRAAVLAGPGELVGVSPPAQFFEHLLGEGGDVPFTHEVRNRATDHFIAVIADHFAEPVVDVSDQAVFVLNAQAVGHRFDELLVLAPTFLERMIGRRAFTERGGQTLAFPGQLTAGLGRGEDGPIRCREQYDQTAGQQGLIRHRRVEEPLRPDNRHALQCGEFLGKVEGLREHNQKRGENHGSRDPGKGLDGTGHR